MFHVFMYEIIYNQDNVLLLFTSLQIVMLKLNFMRKL